jgi:hypothetical protein|tara:strand:- start:6403 stop:6687 length:285 start_codon:yes stop_codon:yes gene_type:complete
MMLHTKSKATTPQSSTNNVIMCIEEFSALFSIPGEGFVAEIRTGDEVRLYDRKGLQHLILERKQLGNKNIQALEKALARINNLGDAIYQNNINN